MESPAHHQEDFGNVLVKLDNDLVLFDRSALPVREHTSLLGGGQDWKHFAGSTSRRWATTHRRRLALRIKPSKNVVTSLVYGLVPWILSWREAEPYRSFY